MRIIEDEICLTIPTGPDTEEKRWWSIRQPPPSIGFSLQGQLAAALGPKVLQGIMATIQISDSLSEDAIDGEGPIDRDLESDLVTMGEALAWKTYRNARMGRALIGEGENIADASNRLRAVLGDISKRFSMELNSPALVGETERKEGGNLDFKWIKPALLHRLLLSSQLKFGGTAAKPRYPSGMELDTSPGADLWRATQQGSVSQFVYAMDKVVDSIDEVFMLCVWATLHLWRPF
jgi:hypothetical protein